MTQKAKVATETQESGKLALRCGWCALTGFVFLKVELLAILSSLLLGAALASSILARKSLQGLGIQISTSQKRTRCGEPVKCILRIENRNRFLPVFFPIFSIRESDTVRIQVYQYPGIVLAKKEVSLAIDPNLVQRGERYLEAFAPRTRFPFALHEAVAELSARSEAIVVWPRPEALDLDSLLHEPPHFKYENAGDHLTLSNNTDGARIRDYLPGDPRPRINWKLSAKRDKLTILEPRDEPQERYELHLETSIELWQNELRFERMLRLVSSLVSQMSRHNLARGITIDRRRFPILSSRDALRFFDALALLAPAQDTAPSEPNPKRNHLWILPASDSGILLSSKAPKAEVVLKP